MPGDDPISYAFVGTKMFVGTSGGGVYLSTNNGANWIAKNTGLLSLNVTGICAIGTTLFVSTEDGGMSMTTDDGSTWTSINNGLNTSTGECNTVISVGSILYMGSKGSGVYKSTDNGSNWTVMSNGLTETDIKVLFSDGVNIFAGTYSNTTTDAVFVSTDGAANWLDVDNGAIQKSIRAFTIQGGYLYLGTGTNTAKVWKRALSEMVSSSTNALTKLENQEIQLYPNPVLDELKIISEVSNDFTVIITSVHGQEMIQQQFSTIEKTIDVSSLSEGSYFISFESSQSSKTYKFIKL